jgi:hypothetical protein
MARQKRLVSLALGALSVLAVAAPAAQAQGTMAAAACVLAPGSVAGTAGVDSIISKLPGLFETDDGAFDFNGNATCAGADVAGPAVVPPRTYTIDASGTYNNLLCGTGTANGTAWLTGTGGNTTFIESTFGITFAAGTGKLSIVVTGGQVQVGTSTVRALVPSTSCRTRRLPAVTA